MATDPLASLDAIIANIGEPSKPKKKRQKAPSLLPELQPEETTSMLGNLTSGVLSGLQYVGETLDKPGRAVRGLLGGKPSELMNLIPFSDSIGITDPRESVSGRDLLEKTGLLKKNKAGLDLGDVAGFGAEILTDPLTLLTGPGKALTKSGAAIAKTGVRDAAGKLLKLPSAGPARKIEEIATGQRGAFGIKNPLHPFSPPAVVFGAGTDWGKKSAEWFYYNPVTRGFRKIFSANPWLKSFDKQLQQAADHEWAIYQDGLAGIEETGIALRQKMPQMQELFDTELKDYLSLPENADLKDMIGGESFDPVAATSDDFLRVLAERGKEDGTAIVGQKRTADSLSSLIAQQPNTPSNILEAAIHFDGFTNEILSLQDQLAGQIKNMGGSVGMLDDTFIGHTARRMNPAIIDEERKRFILEGGKGNRFSFWGGKRRRDILRDIPGGTATLQRMSKDPRLTANPLAFGPEPLYERARILWDEYGLPEIDRTGKSVDEQTDGLVKFFSELPPVAQQTGLFGPDIATNALDYAIHAARLKGALSATHRLVQDTVSSDEIGPTIDEAFRQLFPQGEDARWATSYFVNEYAKKNGLPDINKVYPQKLYVPEPFVQTARKYLEYSRPEKVEGFLKFYDRINALYKGSLYSPFPASHVRNLVSGLWQNMVTAFTNPKIAGTAFKEAIGILRGNPSKYTDEIKGLGIGVDGILQEITGTKGTGGIPSIDLAGGIKTAFQGAKLPFQKGFSRIDNPLNPVNIRGVREGLEEGSTFPLFKAGERAAEVVEFLNRVTHYIARRETGYAPALAKMQTKLAQVDYSNFSDFEKKVLARLVPFYRFSRANLALQLRHLIDNPGGRTAQTIRGINVIRDERDKDSYVPRYLAEGLTVPLGQGADPNTSRFFSSQGLFPVEEAFNRFSFEQGLPNVPRTLEKNAAQLNPMLQSVLESMTGKELWSGRPLDALHPFPTDIQDINYAANKLPTARAMRLTRTWLDERKGTLEKLINTFLGGAKVTDVDVERSLAIEAKEQLSKMLKGQKGIRSFERLYAKPEAQAEMSQDQLEQLALYQAILSELSRISQERAPAASPQ